MKLRRGLLVLAMLFLLLPLGEVSSREPFIDWENLSNPVYSHPGWSTKDACMAYRDGWFYVFFSAFFHEDGRERSHVVGVKTRDFKTFSEPLFIWRGEDEGWTGMCSPNITRVGDVYYLTYNSWGDKFLKPNQLFYATSRDLEHWDKGKPLARNITWGRRAIDAAVAHEGGKYYLVWKEFQTPKAAWSRSMGADGWHRLGKVPPDWFENGEFIKIDNEWHLMCTAGKLRGSHYPALRKMQGTGRKDSDWTRWGEFTKLDIPVEDFNTDETANAAFLADWREHDGHFYLIYAGRTEGDSHLGRGNNKLGLARSRDLENWEVPGEAD